MASPTDEVARLASLIRETQAGPNLPPAIAKLYSQHTRLREQQPGLASWSDEEANERFKDAVRLLEIAFIERESGGEQWRDAVRRAGELLEWLSHPGISIQSVPTRLLATAAYQLAGYPARASGLLKDIEQSANDDSRILGAFLKADFPELQQQLINYWRLDAARFTQIPDDTHWGDAIISEHAQDLIVNETASALGVLCAEMRWGHETRTKSALEKLATLGKVLIHLDQPHSWLLAHLCAEVASVYAASSLRNHLGMLSSEVSELGRSAFERYARQSFLLAKALAWSSQVRGIERLQTNQSFALCTPTGSGKTTVAEIAILQSLFSERTEGSEPSPAPDSLAPLTLYLVPSRALAAEVEAKLSRVLKRVDPEAEIVVTGLYGGTDWGPTDAWLTSSKRTVLICTYEKAEALIRFLGPLFLSRVILVVMDEAHSIQFDGNMDSLRTGDNRTLRLEAVSTRLLAHVDRNGGRFIALSAVAAGVEGALARWATGQLDASPAKTSYRSTRQLVGRLECLPNRAFDLYYDLLDGASLQFDDRDPGAKPYIRNAFPPSPPIKENKNDSLARRLRPQLLWAAMHLAKPDDKGRQRAVLISISERIEFYTEDFLRLLNSPWSQSAPQFFSVPTDPKKLDLWNRCLRSCEDYYGIDSTEYKLLERGIVVHHGKMPGLMARLFVEVIEHRIAHLVVATSTLSEGVNLPFETVLIPSLKRWNGGSLSGREFGNLVGRAGRPGFSTEGRSLVVLPLGSGVDAKQTRQIAEMRNLYLFLIEELKKLRISDETDSTTSPLAELMVQIVRHWRTASESSVPADFLDWLERTAPLHVPNQAASADGAKWLPAVESLDTLDAFLISIVVEAEQLATRELTAAETENHLKDLWQRSYAHYASTQEASLAHFFVTRGKSICTNIYPDAGERRRLYRTSVPPRSGIDLLNAYSQIKETLRAGDDYAVRESEGRLAYVEAVVGSVTSLSKFRLAPVPKGDEELNWRDILGWWLNPSGTGKKPNKRQVANWHKYVAQNFGYKFNWGLGSIIALTIDDAHQGVLRETSLDEWSQLGLPWAVFWLKELMIWGTLEPVAALILSQGAAPTRRDAEGMAAGYYEAATAESNYRSPDELLNASRIRKWLQEVIGTSEVRRRQIGFPAGVEVTLLRDFSRVPPEGPRWRVLPVEVGADIFWLDPAGFPLARCRKTVSINEQLYREFDFFLNTSKSLIETEPYL